MDKLDLKKQGDSVLTGMSLAKVSGSEQRQKGAHVGKSTSPTSTQKLLARMSDALDRFKS